MSAFQDLRDFHQDTGDITAGPNGFVNAGIMNLDSGKCTWLTWRVFPLPLDGSVPTNFKTSIADRSVDV